jgi:outer membrane autotransporter protein
VGDWRLGLLAGYSRSSFDVDDRASSGSSNNYHLGLYGGTQWGNLAFRTGAAYTWHDIDTNRTAAFPGFADSLSADYSAGTFQAFGELGYGIELGATRFEPFANLAHVSLRTDSFTEQGGPAALSVDGGTTAVTFTTLGLRAEHTMALGTVNATLRGMIGWRHAFGDLTPESVNAFAGGDAFTIAGAPIAQDSAVIEAGLDFNLTPEATFGLSYTGQIASDAYDHGFRANLSVRF